MKQAKLLSHLPMLRIEYCAPVSLSSSIVINQVVFLPTTVQQPPPSQVRLSWGPLDVLKTCDIETIHEQAPGHTRKHQRQLRHGRDHE